MKRFLAVFFLLAYVISTNPSVMELAKFPLLVEHYQEHKEIEPQISFKDFLYIHYCQKENKYSDKERDRQMPFKSPVQTVGTFICVIANASEFIVSSKVEFKQLHEQKISTVSAYTSQYLSAIWQPPQLN